jgi:hypothetical protein
LPSEASNERFPAIADRPSMNWLKLLTMAFQIAYGPVESIEIKKEAAN